MATEFILIRHGETEWNRSGRIQGHGDSLLTELGMAQAEATAQRLAQERIDHVYASDLGRAFRTAQIIAAACGKSILQDPRLRERCYGAGEGMARVEFDSLYPQAFSRARETDPDYAIPGGESRRQLFDRVLAAFEALAAQHSGSRVLVVTHGGVLASAYRWLNAIPLEAPHPIDNPNAAYNLIAHEGDAWRIRIWGDTAHLASEAFEAE